MNSTSTYVIDNPSPEFRRDENEFEDPIKDDLRRRELYLDDQLKGDEDFVIQEHLV